MKRSALSLLAAATLSLAFASSAMAQSGGAPGFAPGQAKNCSVGISGNTVEVKGIGGSCGKGSYVTFGLNRVNQFVVEQVCDINKDIRRFMVASPSEDSYVSCFYAGNIDDPARKFAGATLTVR